MPNFAYNIDAAHGRFIKLWTKGVQVEELALAQLYNLASLPFIYKHIAVMPDCHVGIGSTVGSVFATHGAIIPSSIGVDVGCGIITCRTSLTASDLPDSLKVMRSAIEANVPHGRTDNGGVNDRGAWGDPPMWAVGSFNYLSDLLKGIVDKHPRLERASRRAINHVSTLGTGNHFIEVCLDGENRVWVMLHSGSRGIGNAIGTYFIDLAKKDMKKFFINLPDVNLSYFPEDTEHFDDYIEAVSWAQNFACLNRNLMMRQVLAAIENVLDRKFDSRLEVIDCHHNYVTKEHHFGQNVWLTRKGAVRAREGDLGIIPGSMGVKSYIVRGKGNADSYNSCSHGAGRTMSRGQAKKEISLEEHIAATDGIECRKDVDVLDESPRAYKNVDAVMAAQTDLVEIVYTLKQILNVKG